MNQLDFSGRSAVITGGAAGIGLAIAQRLIASGGRVSVWDRDAAALDKARVALTADIDTRVVDVADAASVDAAARAAAAALGRIDALVCSAGITGPNKTMWDYPVDAWRQVMEVNVNGVFLCNRAIVPIMLKQDYGRIVNIASVAGKEGNPNASAYSAFQGRCDRLDQVAGQGARQDRRSRQLRDAGGGKDGDLRPDVATAYRLHAVQDSDRALRESRGDRRIGRVVVYRGLLVLHGCRLRSLRRARYILERG